MKKHLKKVDLKNVKLNAGLLAQKNKLVRKEVIPYQRQALNDELPDTEPSHAVENFKIAAGRSEGEFKGMVFQDSDVAKWLEAVAYQLTVNSDPELEKRADEVIDLIGEAQQEDGYLNTYFIVKEPEMKWKNLAECHELYCAGHLIEAAVAYYKATGKEKFLNIMQKNADLIESKFGPEADKLKGYPGHQEIELALIKLYEVSGKEKYRDLAKFFIDQRGKDPFYFDQEWEERGKIDHWDDFHQNVKRDYYQAHAPVREQKAAAGHAVRALYMYSGMADVARVTGDQSLIGACKQLWDNTTSKQMYITGGTGSSVQGESFTFDYDLPNDTAYTETCAAVALVFFAQRMLHLKKKGEYADVMEKALYNGALSGMSQNGKRFFYVNPLEVQPEVCEQREDHKHVKPTRQKWFGCACCPPNLARLLASIGSYIYSQNEEQLFVNLYADSEAEFKFKEQQVSINQKTNYPWDEEIEIEIKAEKEVEFELALRIPGWCRKAALQVNGKNIDLTEIIEAGYAKIKRKWQNDRIKLILKMPVEKIYANPEVREDIGKVSLQRGPIVYALEEVDNGKNLPAVYLADDAELKAEYKEDLLGGVTVVKGSAYKLDETSFGESLYSTQKPEFKQIAIQAVPYYAWDNRESGEMLVWLNRKI
ncbi:glycoside hydrolase family 127 protein [Halanaerobium saccharolyticum]|uniref:glycoside hydrolase family 127 protein n=1 Tax=Halanaerobium saccharolyticum TaxID=43595 RepID=UPI003FCC455D